MLQLQATGSTPSSEKPDSFCERRPPGRVTLERRFVGVWLYGFREGERGEMNPSLVMGCTGVTGVRGGAFLNAPTSSDTDSVALSFCRAAPIHFITAPLNQPGSAKFPPLM